MHTCQSVGEWKLGDKKYLSFSHMYLVGTWNDRKVERWKTFFFLIEYKIKG